MLDLCLQLSVQVNVKDLEAPQEIEKGRGFEKLVLSSDHKSILKSQVREHFRKRGSQVHNGSTENDMDLVRGKGQGLIILLHGTHSSNKAQDILLTNFRGAWSRQDMHSRMYC